ncbi:MAG: heptosyltransferase II [Thiomicrorhabdus sp.]|nr:MAG: heptosyltransferase II [Thiomicrorhabdus sp.]
MSLIKPSLDFFEPNQRLTIKKHFDHQEIKRIMVIGIDQLGGLAMSSPFFRELRVAYPDAHIVNLVGNLTFGLMQNCPYVDEVWKFDKKQSFKIAKRMKAEGFDLVFLAAGTFRVAMMSYLGKIPNRVGYDNDGTGRLLTVQLHQEFHSRYRPENMFDMLRAIGITPQGVFDREIWTNDSNQAYADNWAEKHNIAQNKILAFNPYSTDPKRRWTDEGWIALLAGVRTLGIKPVMMVAPNEVDGAKALLEVWEISDIDVETHSVTNTAAIFERVNYVIGPESGFIHMALAVKKPHVIAFFNILPPVSTFPVDDPHHSALVEESLDCYPCYLYKFKDQCPNDLKCMSQLKAERVLKQIAQFEAEE